MSISHRTLLLIFLLLQLPLGVVVQAQSSDIDLDSIYLSYMSDSAKAQI